MAEKKAPAKKAAKVKEAPKPKPDVVIVIGAKGNVDVPKGAQLWRLDGQEVTEKETAARWLS